LRGFVLVVRTDLVHASCTYTRTYAHYARVRTGARRPPQPPQSPQRFRLRKNLGRSCRRRHPRRALPTARDRGSGGPHPTPGYRGLPLPVGGRRRKQPTAGTRRRTGSSEELDGYHRQPSAERARPGPRPASAVARCRSP